MAMSSERVVQLCKLSVDAIQEDIAMIEAGALEWRTLAEINITRHQLHRMRAVVSHLQEIIDSCGCNCS